MLKNIYKKYRSTQKRKTIKALREKEKSTPSELATIVVFARSMHQIAF